MRRTLIAGCAAAAVVATFAQVAPAATASVPLAAPVQDVRSPVREVPTAPRFVTSAKQVVVVTASRNKTSHARLRAYQRAGGAWVQVMGVKARIGKNGLVAANQRRQGSLTTPTGMYAMTQSFGINADPGTAMPFTRIRADHYWVGDNSSPFYNEMRLGHQGGFKRKESEHMISYDPDYKYGVVIDFNRPNPVRKRGFAIFLHVNGGGPTAGCVSIPSKQMKKLLTWLNPTMSPTIVIGKASWLSAAG